VSTVLSARLSEPIVSRYLRRLKPHDHAEKVKRWRAFLQDHRKVIAAMDFFTVPVLGFRVLYCFSSSNMAVGASCTSRWRRSPSAIRWCSYGRSFPVRIAMFSSIAMPSSARRFCNFCGVVVSTRSEAAYGVLGRTASPSAVGLHLCVCPLTENAGSNSGSRSGHTILMTDNGARLSPCRLQFPR
jgi:hypothetical protein